MGFVRVYSEVDSRRTCWFNPMTLQGTLILWTMQIKICENAKNLARYEHCTFKYNLSERQTIYGRATYRYQYKTQKLLLILSKYPSWIHLGEFSGENLSCKTTPRWRNLNFPPTRCTLHNLFTLEEMLNNLYSLVIFCTSSQWVSILPWWHNWDSPWCLLESRCDHINLLCLFSWNIGLNFSLW